MYNMYLSLMTCIYVFPYICLVALTYYIYTELAVPADS